MTPITLLLQCFDNMFFYKKRAVEIKAPVKVNPFSVFLLSDWSGLLCTDQIIFGRQAPGCMNVRHFMTNSLFR